LLLLVGFDAATHAQTSSSNPDKKSPASPPSVQPVKGLDGLKLPSDAIIVVCEQAADAMRLLPRGP